MVEPKLEVPPRLRRVAEKTIDQAEEAFGMFFDAASKSMTSMPGAGTGNLDGTVLHRTEYEGDNSTITKSWCRNRPSGSNAIRRTFCAVNSPMPANV